MKLLSRQWLKRYLFSNEGLKQTILKNTFWLMVSNVSGRLIRAALLIYVARILGTAGYGVFSYATSLAAFFSLFSDIGVNGMLTREGAKNPRAFPELIATSFVLKALLLLGTVVLIFLAVPFITKIPEALVLLPLTALLVVFDGFRDLSLSVIRATERAEQEAGITISTNLAISALGLGLLMFSPSPYFLLLGYTLGSGVGTLFGIWTIRRYFHGFRKNIRMERMKPILVEGFPFGLLGLLGGIMLNTDMVMLGWLAKAEDVGLYSAAQRPVQLLYLIPIVLSTALFPAMARFAMETGDRFRNLLERAITFSFLVAIPILVGGSLLARPIIVLLFGADFGGATLSFALLLATLLFTFPTVLIGNGIFAHNQQRSFLSFLAIGAIANILFNFLLIPRWGIAGSAVATIISQGLSYLFIWMKLKRITSFDTLRHLPRIFTASLVMGIAVFYLADTGLNVVLSILAGGILYAVVLFLLREPLLSHIRPKALQDNVAASPHLHDTAD